MRPGRALLAAGVVLGSIIIAGGVAAVISGGHHTPASDAAAARPVRDSGTPGGVTPTSSAGWRAVAPATTVPTSSPVQQQYDEGFERGFSSHSNTAMMTQAESLSIPPPAIGGGWPQLSPADTPDGWATEFIKGLLDVNFPHQSRSSLGSWLVAEEAPDLMPGIPTAFQNLALYVTVMAPGITGQPSPIPSGRQWRADAAAGVRWSVSDLEAQLEPQWQQMIGAGWQPRDLRAAVEDVTGLLDIRHGNVSITRRFSLVVQVGSAHWRASYGTVLVSDWRES